MSKKNSIIALFTSILVLSACSDESSVVSKVSASPSPSVENDKGADSTALSKDAIKAILEQKLNGIEITSIEPSPRKGIFQVFYNGQILYVTDDGGHVFTGNLLGLIENGPVNLTEKAMSLKSAELAPERAEVIAAINEKDMVVFKAKNEKHVVSVFTDVDCAYCRKLHKEVPQLNEKGITVRYLAFPRAGVGSSAYDKLVSVWCADDKQLAMDNAKLKREFSPKSCENPVASQYALTRDFALSGTPAVLLDDGELIAGYVPHEKLLKHLENKSERKNAASNSPTEPAES